MLAAVHLDGGFEVSRTVTRRIFSEELANISTQQELPGAGDYKTQFQEWCQKQHDTLPRYETVRETGPDHQKVFEVELSIQGKVVGIGPGEVKRKQSSRRRNRPYGREGPDLAGCSSPLHSPGLGGCDVDIETIL